MGNSATAHCKDPLDYSNIVSYPKTPEGGDAMSPIENERFIEIIISRLKHPVDEVWGPVAPNVRTNPHLRELHLAYSMASLADSLELAQDGLGESLLTKFAEDPEGICPPWPIFIHWPPKGGGGTGPDPEPPIDRAVLGAALAYVAQFLGNQNIANVAVAKGEGMVG